MTRRRRKKKTDRAGLRAGGSGRDRAVERRRSGALSGHPAAWSLLAARRPSRLCSRTSTSEEAPPNCSRSFARPPASIRAKGVVSVTNAVLHPWLKEQLVAGAGRDREGAPRGDAPAGSRASACCAVGNLAGPRAAHVPSPPCASSWCWIIWRGICRMTWCAGSLSMG